MRLSNVLASSSTWCWQSALPKFLENPRCRHDSGSSFISWPKHAHSTSRSQPYDLPKCIVPFAPSDLTLVLATTSPAVPLFLPWPKWQFSCSRGFFFPPLNAWKENDVMLNNWSKTYCQWRHCYISFLTLFDTHYCRCRSSELAEAFTFSQNRLVPRGQTSLLCSQCGLLAYDWYCARARHVGNRSKKKKRLMKTAPWRDQVLLLANTLDSHITSSIDFILYFNCSKN